MADAENDNAQEQPPRIVMPDGIGLFPWPEEKRAEFALWTAETLAALLRFRARGGDARGIDRMGLDAALEKLAASTFCQDTDKDDMARERRLEQAFDDAWMYLDGMVENGTPIEAAVLHVAVSMSEHDETRWLFTRTRKVALREDLGAYESDFSREVAEAAKSAPDDGGLGYPELAASLLRWLKDWRRKRVVVLAEILGVKAETLSHRRVKRASRAAPKKKSGPKKAEKPQSIR